jgi:hypothetical protein
MGAILRYPHRADELSNSFLALSVENATDSNW